MSIDKIKIKLDDGAFVPTRAHEDDAGMDLFTPIDVTVPKSTTSMFYGVEIGSVSIDTGVHIEIPKGYVGFIKSKSGLNVRCGITSEGVIDSGYTGSIVVKLYNHTDTQLMLHRGDKISQLVILPIETPQIEIVEELEETERGNGGFGSTGV